MTTTDGYIRQIEHVLANDQHIVHNSPTVTDLLRELKAELESLKGQVNTWVDLCAKEQTNTKTANTEIVRLRTALNGIAWPADSTLDLNVETIRDYCRDVLAIGTTASKPRPATDRFLHAADKLSWALKDFADGECHCPEGIRPCVQCRANDALKDYRLQRERYTNGDNLCG